ncbi:MAG TPA: DUF790 family protein [Kofleriaceae bacterium]|nr:DUF790 family protein [Kofleriaceae bacterium]
MTRRQVVIAPAPRATHVASRHAAKVGGARVAAASQLAVLAEHDLDWIAEAIDLLEQHLGKPWRVVIDAFDELPSSRRRITAVRGALARLLGTAGTLTPLARRVREAVLGAPVLVAEARAARIAAAAAALGVAVEEVESLLFIDLRGERPIAFPRGRPSELEVAATANVVLIQRALRRAHRVRLVLHGDDGTLLRAALARGLLVTASRATADAATVLDIVGPLALFQRTAIYGRALGQLVPLLAHAADFELVLEAPEWRTRIAAPVVLPKAPIDRAGTYHPRRLARGLEQLDPELRVIVGPVPVQAGTTLLCPDLAIEERGERWYVELVGFWTADSLAAKLAHYAAAEVRVKLCIDDARGCGDAVMIRDPQIVTYTRSLDPARLLSTSA